jgi:hypothetical protein
MTLTLITETRNDPYYPHDPVADRPANSPAVLIFLRLMPLMAAMADLMTNPNSLDGPNLMVQQPNSPSSLTARNGGSESSEQPEWPIVTAYGDFNELVSSIDPR